ncbi:MAG TPA: hypothetical protein VKU02_23590 [Gemmataceae bacterium]|nr:hypothetical protein [Gemmataceae bacterium]
MRGMLAVCLGLALGLPVPPCRADDGSSPPPYTDEAPLVTLGRPVPLGVTSQKPAADSVQIDVQLRPAAYLPPPPPEGTPNIPAAAIAGPPLAAPPPGAVITPPNPTEQYNCGVVTRSPGSDPSYWEKCRQFFTGIPGYVSEEVGRRPLFQSDHAFDGFISPITNPFFFEDPRSLTEVRPLFLYQSTPIHNPIFHGGDIEYAGLQARLAFTDCFSLVLTKLGEVWIEPHNATPDIQPHAGFSELVIGPKYTFWRGESTGTLAAVGLNLDVPAGSRQVVQNTGSLSLEPYLSVGQSFGHTSYGTFQALGTFGYNFSVDSQRSDNLFLSLHLDFDYAGLHKIYPLVELNWFHYTSNGKARTLNFEGGDLFNFGSSQVSGHDDLSLAVGGRFKLNECFQMGLAAEVPVTSHRRDLMDYRLLVDLIFRY